MGLKVAMITPWNVKCGIYTYSRSLIEGLIQHDAEVYVVRLPRFGGKTPEILTKVVRSIPLKDIDVIHVQEEYGLYKGLEGGFYGALANTGKPIISTMHAAGNFIIDKVVREVSEEVIVHNDYCSRLFRLPCKIIPHGAKPIKTPPINECKTALHLPQEFVVGYCGFISEYKGLEALIEAVIDVPKAALLIAGGYHAGGDTTYIMKLKRYSLQMLAHRCQWLGWVPDERLAITYGAMDLVVYPSIIATESGALITAMSHGKAVIASRIPPFVEKQKMGAIQTFKDVPDLTRKIKRLMRRPKEKRKLEKGAKEYCIKTSWSNVAGKHIELYKDAIFNHAYKIKQQLKQSLNK